jgi:putative transcriptional regulator
VADRCGVSRQAINAIETERYDASLPPAFTIASVFGPTIEEIFVPDRPGTTNDRPGPEFPRRLRSVRAGSVRERDRARIAIGEDGAADLSRGRGRQL